jgi:two-component system nitrogen regulation response regulator NtrX
MISGHASVEDAVSAVQKGATDFFEKPVDRDRVTSRVRNALAHVRSSRRRSRGSETPRAVAST